MDGKKLRHILASTGKTEAQIAELLDMTVSQLGRQFDMADVTTGLVEELADALKLPVAFFFGRERSYRSERVVAERGPVELPFTTLQLDLPLSDGEKVRYMAAAIIDDRLELDIYPMEKLQKFQWPADKEVVFFVFRNENECLIRHFSKTRSFTGCELIGESGYRIVIDSLPSPVVCLYQDRRKVDEVPIDGLDMFCDALYILWEKYRSCLLEQNI